jgi:adenosine deaminase
MTEEGEYDKIVQIEDVLEDKFIKPLDYTEDDERADYVIKTLTDFNNSIAVKQSLRYIPYNDFHTGYNNLHSMKNNRAVLTGKEQLEKNSLFHIMKQMPKGAHHHAHLYTFVEYPKIIKYILGNQDEWEDNLYICTDPNSKYYLWPFMLPKNEYWKDLDADCNKNGIDYSNYENGVFKTPIKQAEDINITDNTGVLETAIASNNTLIYIKDLVVNKTDIIIGEIQNQANKTKIVFENECSPNINILCYQPYTITKKVLTNIQPYNTRFKGLIKTIYTQENYTKHFFIKLDIFNFESLCLKCSSGFTQPTQVTQVTQVTQGADPDVNAQSNPEHKPDLSILCQNVSDLFPECEAVPNCIYEMWAFSQPFYDLHINKFIRQNNVYLEESGNNVPRNKDYLTKWDLLDTVADLGGSITKHYRIFPYFFALSLLNSYYDDRLRVVEFRTPIGNLYFNGINSDKFDRIKIQCDKLINNDDGNLKNIISNSNETIIDGRLKCSLYHLLVMEYVSYIVNNSIINDKIESQSLEAAAAAPPPPDCEDGHCKNDCEEDRTACSLNYLNHIIKNNKGNINQSFTIENTSCGDFGSKTKEISEKIDNLLSGFTTSGFKGDVFLNPINYDNGDYNLKQKEEVQAQFENFNKERNQQYIDKCKAGVPPITYILIGAAAKDKLVSNLDCNKILVEMSSTYLMSYYLQKHQERNVSDNSDRYLIYRNRIAGFDLYGEEDIHHTDGPYEKMLLFFKQHAYDNDIKWNYFLHAGENHNYIEKNSNLLVSILLDAKRIGHGIRLIGSNALMELVKSKGICVECCPISNQLLDYTPNLSFHPALFYINNGINVSISTDDQNLYGYDSLAYDYTSIVNSWNLNLKQLKKLVENSLIHSSYKVNQNLLKEFNDSWDSWVKKFYNDKYVNMDNIIKNLISMEYVKLKTNFNKKYSEKIKKLENYSKEHFGKDDQEFTDEYIKTNIFNERLSSTFIGNIENHYNFDTKKFFNQETWHFKCELNYTENSKKKMRLQEATPLPLPVPPPAPAPVPVIAHNGGGKSQKFRVKTSRKTKRRRL